VISLRKFNEALGFATIRNMNSGKEIRVGFKALGRFMKEVFLALGVPLTDKTCEEIKQMAEELGIKKLDLDYSPQNAG
ncbi:MAG: hypothetical protein J7L54_02745, partial [Elusimicrobia bacterium]|nr:hypothetical protein [Elusimicrobiota bacterium]